MPVLMPTDITGSVRRVLTALRNRHGEDAVFLTAYQILELLPARTKQRLIRERGVGGTGGGKRSGEAGSPYAATKVVSDAAKCLPGVEITYLETRTLQLSINGSPVVPSPKRCALFRLTGPPGRTGA
jgi:hypothetical protein